MERIIFGDLSRCGWGPAEARPGSAESTSPTQAHPKRTKSPLSTPEPGLGCGVEDTNGSVKMWVCGRWEKRGLVVGQCAQNSVDARRDRKGLPGLTRTGRLNPPSHRRAQGIAGGHSAKERANTRGVGGSQSAGQGQAVVQLTGLGFENTTDHSLVWTVQVPRDVRDIRKGLLSAANLTEAVQATRKQRNQGLERSRIRLSQ